MKLFIRCVLYVIPLFLYANSACAIPSNSAISSEPGSTLSRSSIPDGWGTEKYCPAGHAQEIVSDTTGENLLLAQNQNETADDLLPMQEDSADPGTSQRAKKAKSATSAEQRISLAEAQRNGIPTPIEFKPIVGKVEKLKRIRKKFQTQGLWNKPIDEKETFFRYKKIIFKTPDESGYSSEVWLEYPDNPSKSGDRSIWKESLSKKNEALRKRFPVPVLKTGAGWQNSVHMLTTVPVNYRVVGIKSINGYDCVEIEGTGEVKEDRLVHKYTVSYCYDYNNYVDVYYKSHYQTLNLGNEKPLSWDEYTEDWLESLSYE